ncbi:hypothetical protein ACTFIY_010596 [Dictyostelium cf. discoideum]
MQLGRTYILNAGATNTNENKVVLSKLVKFVNNKRSNTHIKAIHKLRLLIRNRVEQFGEIPSQVPSLMEYESITPFDLATLFIDTVSSKAFDSDPFLMHCVVYLFNDSPDALTDTEKVAFEFTSTPLYTHLNKSIK